MSKIEVPIKEKIMTKKRFSTAVELMVSKHSMTYIDAATYIVEDWKLDFRNLKRLLTPSLKQKITFNINILLAILPRNIKLNKKTNNIVCFFYLAFTVMLKYRLY